MNAFTPSNFGPTLRPLLEIDRRRSLNSGRPVTEMHGQLARVTIECAFASSPVADRDMAGCCLSAVWLIHDFLDEAHTICQDIPTTSGRYWHAIMHRREGDYSNAKYWLRRVGKHEVMALLGRRADELAAARSHGRAPERLCTDGIFDPASFVDLVEAAVAGRRPEAVELCLDIQQAEWEILFVWCYQRAVGA